MTDEDREPIELDTELVEIRESALDALRRRFDLDAGLDAIIPTRRAGRPARPTPDGADDADGAAQSVRRPVVTTVDDAPSKAEPRDDDARAVAPVTVVRVAQVLERLDIRYLTDGDGSLLALWERHGVLFALEGPEREILVIRVRPHATVAPGWADRAHRVVNEWNHTRRFYKAYVGDRTDRGQLPIYAEMQVPLMAGVHDALLLELIDCAVVVAMGFVDWLHDDGALL